MNTVEDFLVEHYCFYLLQLGYELIKYRISFYSQKTVYSEFREYPRSINEEGYASRVALFVNCFAVVVLFGFAFITFQNRTVIAFTAIAFPQDTHIGRILDEVESLVDSSSLSFHSIIKNLLLQTIS